MASAILDRCVRGASPIWLSIIITVGFFCCSCSRPSAEVEQLKVRAERGEAMAQSSLGYRYLVGAGVKKDPAAAAQWFRKAAEQGDIGAEYFLGGMLLYGQGIPKDEAEGQKWLNKADAENPQNPSYQFRHR